MIGSIFRKHGAVVEVSPKLFVGPARECAAMPQQFAIVHVMRTDTCKSKKKHADDIDVQLDDPGSAYGLKHYISEFRKAVLFIKKNIKNRCVYVHCFAGVSRSPSICFLYLGYAGLLPKDYTTAYKRFRAMYPAYSQLGGYPYIMERVWNEIVR